MTRGRKSGRELVRVTPALAGEIVRRLDADRTALKEAVVENVLLEARSLETLDLWEQQQDAAVSYWVLMLTGVNQSKEMAIAQELLVWQAFFSKESARVACVQSSERPAFRHCSAAFGVHTCPTLVLSDAPEMKSYIKIEGGLLTALARQEGEIQAFLTRLHSMIESGMTLQRVQDQMNAEAFYRGIKVVYKEVKGLVSLKIGMGS